MIFGACQKPGSQWVKKSIHFYEGIPNPTDLHDSGYPLVFHCLRQDPSQINHHVSIPNMPLWIHGYVHWFSSIEARTQYIIVGI